MLTEHHYFSSIVCMMKNDMPINQLLNFDDLDFKPHRHADGVQAVLDLGNDISISVVANNDGGQGLYGQVSDGLYEVAVFYKNDMVPLSPADDVVGWQSSNQISYLMMKAQVEAFYWVDELRDAKREYRRELELDS